jgi:hypothetical protein
MTTYRETLQPPIIKRFEIDCNPTSIKFMAVRPVGMCLNITDDDVKLQVYDATEADSFEIECSLGWVLLECLGEWLEQSGESGEDGRIARKKLYHLKDVLDGTIAHIEEFAKERN